MTTEMRGMPLVLGALNGNCVGSNRVCDAHDVPRGLVRVALEFRKGPEAIKGEVLALKEEIELAREEIAHGMGLARLFYRLTVAPPPEKVVGRAEVAEGVQ